MTLIKSVLNWTEFSNKLKNLTKINFNEPKFSMIDYQVKIRENIWKPWKQPISKKNDIKGNIKNYNKFWNGFHQFFFIEIKLLKWTNVQLKKLNF